MRIAFRDFFCPVKMFMNGFYLQHLVPAVIHFVLILKNSPAETTRA